MTAAELSAAAAGAASSGCTGDVVSPILAGQQQMPAWVVARLELALAAEAARSRAVPGCLVEIPARPRRR